jgi:hypothetical protein
MISREAVSFDLEETLAILASGQSTEARKQLGQIIENLRFLLSPSGGRKNKDSTAADELGRANVEALFTLCDQAAAAIALRDNDLALRVMNDAARFWDALPDTRLDELLRRLQRASLHASAGEPAEAMSLIDAARLAVDAVLFKDKDKPTLRATRAAITEAGLGVMMRDFQRSILALDSAIRMLEGEGKQG